MQAFAEGSLNNALGGSGPVNRKLDFDTFHGRNTEGYLDYNTGQNKMPDPIQSQSQMDSQYRGKSPPRVQPQVMRRPVPAPGSTAPRKEAPIETPKELPSEPQTEPLPQAQFKPKPAQPGMEIFDPKASSYEDNYYGTESAGWRWS